MVPYDDNDENAFWMSYEDILKRFSSLIVCKAINMDEIRLRGKFLRIQDVNEPQHEIVISKWYYSIEVEFQTRVIIGVHQEDERKIGVLARKPYLDIGIAVLRRTNEGLKLIDLRDFQQSRQCELELTLEPGSYIIQPRTTGCLLKGPDLN